MADRKPNDHKRGTRRRGGASRIDSDLQTRAELLALYQDELSAGNDLKPAEFLELRRPQSGAICDHPGLRLALLECYSLHKALAGDCATSVEEMGQVLLQLGKAGSSQQTSAAPLRLGPYEIEGPIRSGGMGKVFSGKHSTLNRKAAIKIPDLDRVDSARKPRIIARFLRETRILARLSHPNVVRVFDAGLENGVPYVAMEHVEGSNLSAARPAEVWPTSSPARNGELECSKSASPDYRALARSFAGVARGLHYVHQKGVIHRDIKPANLMVEPNGCLRIIDFGLSRATDEIELTYSAPVPGTLPYSSPEQILGLSTFNRATTDIYSLGVTLYEVLTGYPPFTGDNVLQRILEHRPGRPRIRNPRIPADLERIVLKCIEKGPADRFATAEKLARELERFANGENVPVGPVPRRKRVGRWALQYRYAISASLAFAAFAGVQFEKQRRWDLEQAAGRSVRAAMVDAAFAAELRARDTVALRVDLWSYPTDGSGFTWPNDGAEQVVYAVAPGRSLGNAGAPGLEVVANTLERAAMRHVKYATESSGLRFRDHAAPVTRAGLKGALGRLAEKEISPADPSWQEDATNAVESSVAALLAGDFKRIQSELAFLERQGLPSAGLWIFSRLGSQEEVLVGPTGDLQVSEDEVRLSALALRAAQKSKNIVPNRGSNPGSAGAGSKSGDPASPTDELILEGFRLLENQAVPGNLGAARAKFEEALKEDQDNAIALNNLAVCLELDGPDSLLSLLGPLGLYQRAASAAPQLGAVRYNLGWCLHRLKRVTQAENEYTMALKHGFVSSATNGQRGLCRKWLGKLSDSLEDMEVTYGGATDPQSEWRWIHNDATVRERANQAKDHQAVAARYARCIGMEPGNRWVDALSDLANMEMIIPGMSGEALRHLKTALRLDPVFPWASNNLSAVLQLNLTLLPDQAERREAILWLEEAISSPHCEALTRETLRALREATRDELNSFPSIDSLFTRPDLLIAPDHKWDCKVVDRPDQIESSWSSDSQDDPGWVSQSSPFGTSGGLAGPLLLRRKFTPPADSKLARLVFSLRADAGVCVFLNGALAYELRVIPGKGLAEKAIENPVSPPPVDEIALDPESLKEGENELSLIALRRTNDRAEFLSELRLEAWRTTGQFGADADALRQRLATLTAQANQLPGTRSAELLTYLEARILEAEGKIPEALRFFQTAFEQNKKRSVASQQSPRVDSTLWRPEPLLGVARCLEKQGKSADAELELRAALSLAGWGWKPSLWDEWLRLCFADLKLTAAETLAIVPTPPNENHVRPVNRHADTLWLLRMLNYGPQRDLRINCGGEPYWEGEEGETLWGGDHFFLGGYPECVARIYKTAPRQPFLEWVRVFEGGLLVPAYRVPLPSGQYSITVHCSFVTVRANQIWVPPQFDLRIEGEQHAASDGLLGTSTSLGPYKTRVADGALDIGLVCRSGDVVLGGIEIHRTGD